MNYRQIVSVAAVELCATATAAHASSYSNGSLTANFGFTQNYGGTVETFDGLTANSTNGANYNAGYSSGSLAILGGAGTLTLNGAQIVNGSASGDYAAPNPGVADATNYVSVYNNGAATFSLTHGAGGLGIEWGSVDTSNSLSFYGKTGNLLGTITGQDIVNTLAGVNTTGGPGAGTNWGPGGTIYADIVSSAQIYSVVAGSGQNSFEFDNVSAVPLPAALPLFGAALAALGGFGFRMRRRQPD
jgi:hypothetical protein